MSFVWLGSFDSKVHNEIILKKKWSLGKLWKGKLLREADFTK